MGDKSENVNPAVIKKTQDTLGRIIQAPSLTDKLLSRPPVQFIQDIVKSVVKNTGFMKGLYTAEELDGAYIKASKENKILFLKKLITIVYVVTGEQLGVKESKIAAGTEADKTNELLQSLAKAINMKPDNDDIVKKALKKIKSGEEAEAEVKEDKKPEKDEKKSSRQSAERGDDKQSREREKEKQSKEREAVPASDDNQIKPKRKDEKQAKDKVVASASKPSKEVEKAEKAEPARASRSKPPTDENADSNSNKKKTSSSADREQPKANDAADDKKKSRSMSNKRNDVPKDEDDDDDEEFLNGKNRQHNSRRSKNGDTDEVEDDTQSNSQARLRRPTSAKGGRKIASDRDDNEVTQPTPQEDVRNIPRPTTARPSAPRKRQTAESDDPQTRLLSSSKKVPATTLIVDKDSESDDDFVVKEQKILDEQKLKNGLDGDDDDGEDFGDGKQHGALVKKILESKEQLENGSTLVNKKNEIQKPAVQMDAQRKKEKERVQKEIDKLKEAIQTLTKSSIPLGRTLDFLQEDIDMMQKELFKWKEESEHHSKALKRQQLEANLSLEPYKSALTEVTNNINEQLEKIASVKRKITINEEKITKLLFGIVKGN